MTGLHYVGIALILIFVMGAGVYSGRSVKTVRDFEGGKRASSWMVLGGLINTIVGGASTIGTAQLAYTNGLSSCWFTIGSSAGLLLLAFVFLKPFYDSGVKTVPQFIEGEYGPVAGVLAALFNTLGSLLSIVAQILSGVALVVAIYQMSEIKAAILVGAIMFLYIWFGGILSANYAGIIKTILLCISIGVCGIIALTLFNGETILIRNEILPGKQYFNLFSRGIWVDGGAGLSAFLGVITTQGYVGTVLSAKNQKVSRRGIVACAVVIPFIGLAGMIVGIYMRVYYPGVDTKMALPMFILEKISPLAAGMMLATMLVVVAGSGAGLTLGVSSVLYNNIYVRLIHKHADSRKALTVSRVMVLVVLVLCVFCTTGHLGDFIMNWTFLSRGLRGTVGFLPICGAVFLPGKISKKYVIAAIIAGPFFTILGKFIMPATVDSIFLGMTMAGIVMGLGYIVNALKHNK